MTRVLAVSDEVDQVLWTPAVRRLRPDVVLAAGDLPFDYIEYLVSTLNVPVAFVPGNHDPELGGTRLSRAGLALRSGLPAQGLPGPAGAFNVDGQCVEIGGLRVAGLGGSPRYRPGPHQYTDRQQRLRARRLIRAARHEIRRHGPRDDDHGVDVLLTHAPPRGVGDGDDLPHRGFPALLGVVEALNPRCLLHGHVHPVGLVQREHQLGSTRVINVVGRRLLDL